MTSVSTTQVVGLFATPLMRVQGLINAATVADLIAGLAAADQTGNARANGLVHTPIASSRSSLPYAEIESKILPKIAELGVLIFGQSLPWAIKEMWGNILQPGGHQPLHNHANCFISGVLYLTRCDADNNTVFAKGMGGLDFVFRNASSDVQLGQFNADKWISPDVAPGDVVLFPSYLLHEVPKNSGGLRMSIAFNAVPARLDSWGYGIGFTR
ncbi:MAG: putative 2OG-Fe(II) oxygenase [Pseudomonadota bacterium]